MTIKRFLLILLIAFLTALFWPSMALALGIQEPPTEPALPYEFVAGLTILAGFLVNKGVELVLAHFRIDLSQRVETLTQGLVTTLIGFFSGLFGSVPPMFQGVATEILILIGLALAGLGVKMLFLDNNAAKMGYSSGKAFLTTGPGKYYGVSPNKPVRTD